MESTPELAPLVGRQTILIQLQHRVLDPPNHDLIIVTGPRGIGKTRLLQHFCATVPANLVAIYQSMQAGDGQDPFTWISGMVETTNATLAATFRIPEGSIPQEPIADWLRDQYLPRALAILRAHRHLIWCFDDAKILIQQVENIALLQSCLRAHQQFTVILALAPMDIPDGEPFTSFISPTRVIRLTRLNDADSRSLLRYHIPDISDDLGTYVAQMTGGHPGLLHAVGRRFTQTDLHRGLANRQHLDAALHQVYRANDALFRERWQSLNRNERLVLTALASLRDESREEALVAARIGKWLRTRDYPLNKTSIAAAVRGLDYREIVRMHPDHTIKLADGMMERWLLDHARLDDWIAFSAEPKQRWQQILLVVLVFIAFLLALIAFRPETYPINPVNDPATLPIPTEIPPR